jgi:hypothetical protein
MNQNWIRIDHRLSNRVNPYRGLNPWSLIEAAVSVGGNLSRSAEAALHLCVQTANVLFGLRIRDIDVMVDVVLAGRSDNLDTLWLCGWEEV